MNSKTITNSLTVVEYIFYRIEYAFGGEGLSVFFIGQFVTDDFYVLVHVKFPCKVPAMTTSSSF